MVRQLSRSKARKLLTNLCSEAIIEQIQERTTPNSSEMEMRISYLSSLNITLGNAVEIITARKIPEELVNKGHVLSLFEKDIDKISMDEKEQSILNVRRFILENNTRLAEEDLGGVSELFSGHRAIWKDNEVKLVHDPARRDAGKIYTPYDVTEYMCSQIAQKMLVRC